MENKIILPKKVKEKSILTQRVSIPERIFFIAMAIFCGIYAFSLCYPLVWLVLKSITGPGDYILTTTFDFSKARWENFEHYIRAFNELQLEGINFGGMLVNSAWYVGIGTLQTIFWHATTAYIVSKYRFKGRNFLYNLVIINSIIPVYGTGGATYALICSLGLYDKGIIYLIFTSFGGFGGQFLTMVGLFKGISWEYAEAVYIDGGGDTTVYFRIMLPQAMPMLSALAIAEGVALWNNYEGPLMYLPGTPTVASGLYNVQSKIASEGKPLYFCGLVITVIPIMILYGFIAEKMMTNLSIGGLKG